ncbi:hypothetical protein Q1J52_24795 [Pseudomonas lijiangensis]
MAAEAREVLASANQLVHEIVIDEKQIGEAFKNDGSNLWAQTG